MPQTDEQLAESAKTGDEVAFKQLMDRYIGPIYNFALQYARNEEDAEDIVQDAFFKTWKHIRRFSSGRSFKPWLYTIARNTALDHLKKKKSVVFSTLDDAENDIVFADTLKDPEPLPQGVFENTETALLLEKSMETLHPDHRAVLVLHYHQEMTFEEIALAMQKPMNTVKSWHRRALQRIRPHIVERLSDKMHQDKP
jgi:RNA polymerase sigma-70 factor (ECF subfamily)